MWVSHGTGRGLCSAGPALRTCLCGPRMLSKRPLNELTAMAALPWRRSQAAGSKPRVLLATRSRELQTPKDAHPRWLFLCPK